MPKWRYNLWHTPHRTFFLYLLILALLSPYFTITAPNTEYGKIREALKEILPEGKEFLEDTVCWLPLNEVELNGDKELEQMERLLALLEEDEDVQDVYHNVTGLPLGDE